MKKTVFYLSVLTMLLLASCKPSNPTQIMIKENHDKVMVVHDEVMPKMSDIRKLRKKLKKMDGAEAKALVTQLEDADDAMMDWMHQYKKPSQDHEDLERFFEDQMTSVNEMKDKMLKAISDASAHLENNPPS